MKIRVKHLAIALAVFAAPMATPTAAFAESAAVYTSWKNNLAVGGYDAVSFFSGTPVEGQPAFSYNYNGAEWLFSTQANRDLFAANPEAFAPQYGGYCAWAVAQNKLAKGSPKHWSVRDGKLYLNYNGKIKDRWEADASNFVNQSEVNWPTLLEK